MDGRLTPKYWNRRARLLHSCLSHLLLLSFFHYLIADEVEKGGNSDFLSPKRFSPFSLLFFSFCPISRKSDWHRSASRSPGKSMKSNIWGTTGKKEASCQAEGGSPSYVGLHPPNHRQLRLHLWGSSAERQALGRINNAENKQKRALSVF